MKKSKIVGLIVLILQFAVVFTEKVDKKIKNQLIGNHNYYRYYLMKGNSKHPPAENMNLLTWDDALATEAEKLAKKCTKSNETEKINIAKKNSDMGYVETWFIYGNQYDYNSNNCSGNRDHCRMFKHLIWSTAERFGCGLGVCVGIETLLCTYDPLGNLDIEHPYKKISVAKQKEKAVKYGVSNNYLIQTISFICILFSLVVYTSYFVYRKIWKKSEKIKSFIVRSNQNENNEANQGSTVYLKEFSRKQLDNNLNGSFYHSKSYILKNGKEQNWTISPNVLNDSTESTSRAKQLLASIFSRIRSGEAEAQQITVKSGDACEKSSDVVKLSTSSEDKVSVVVQDLNIKESLSEESYKEKEEIVKMNESKSSGMESNHDEQCSLDELKIIDSKLSIVENGSRKSDKSYDFALKFWPEPKSNFKDSTSYEKL